MTNSSELHTRTSRLQSVLIPTIAYSLIYTLLYLIPNLTPIYTGVFIENGGLRPSSAGWVNTSFLAAMTISALSASLLLARISARTLAFFALAVQVIGFAFPFIVPGNGAVAVAMVVAGLGNGALFAVANAAVAHERYPVLIYGAGIVFSSLASAAVPLPLYAAVGAFSVPGLFLVPLLLIPVIFVTSFVLPKKNLEEAAEPLKTLDVNPKKTLNAAAIALLAAIFLTNLFNMVFYAYADRVLAEAGFDMNAIGTIFMGVYFAAAVGGAIAAFMAKWETKQSIMLILSTLLLLGAILLATSTNSSPLLLLGLNAEGALAMLAISLQLAVAADIDVTGKVAALASAVLFASWTVGPALGGWALEMFGIKGLFTVVAILGPIALALLIFTHVRRRSASPRAQADDSVMNGSPV